MGTVCSMCLILINSVDNIHGVNCLSYISLHGHCSCYGESGVVGIQENVFHSIGIVCTGDIYYSHQKSCSHCGSCLHLGSCLHHGSCLHLGSCLQHKTCSQHDTVFILDLVCNTSLVHTRILFAP